MGSVSYTCLPVYFLGKTKSRILYYVNLLLIDHRSLLRQGEFILHMWKMPEKSEESSSSINADKLTSATNPDKASSMAIAILLDKYCYPVVLPKSRDVVRAGSEEAEGTERGQREMPNHLKKQFAAIVATDPLHPLSPEDKELLWHFRQECMRSPRYHNNRMLDCSFFTGYLATSPFMPPCFQGLSKAVGFSQVGQTGRRVRNPPSVGAQQCVGQQVRWLLHCSCMYVDSWLSVGSPAAMLLPFSGLDVGLAMQLLDCHYSDAQVRSMAVRKLETLEDDDVLRYLLQLVQVSFLLFRISYTHAV